MRNTTTSEVAIRLDSVGTVFDPLFVASIWRYDNERTVWSKAASGSSPEEAKTKALDLVRKSVDMSLGEFLSIPISE